MHGHDIFEAVAVQIGHRQAVAATQLDASERFVVDQMLAPAYESRSAGLRLRLRFRKRLPVSVGSTN